MTNSSFVRTWDSQRYRTILVAIAGLIPLVIAGMGWSYFTLNDDGAVLSLLRSGEARTLIISYPMSCFLVALYKLNAEIPWYSLFVVFMLAVGTATMTYAVLSNSYADRIQKILLLSIVLYFCIFYSNNINYTSVVTLVFASVYMMILSLGSHCSKRLLALLLPLVLLTRCGDIIVILLAFSSLPLILNTSSFKSGFLRTLIILLITLAVFQLNKYPVDGDYQTYKKFSSVRSIYNDLSYPIDVPSADANDKLLFNRFFPHDEDTFSTKTLTENAPQTLRVISYRLFNKKLNTVYDIILNHGLEYFLIGISLCYVSYYNNKFFNKAFFIAITLIAMSIVLFKIRDVDRLSTGILFLILSTIHLMPKKSKTSIKPFFDIKCDRTIKEHNDIQYILRVSTIRPFLFVIIFMMIIIQIAKFTKGINKWVNSSDILRPRECKVIKDNILKNKELKNSLLLPDLTTSPSMCYTFRLGNEINMLGYPSEGWLPAGWLSRSPIYYKTLRSLGSDNFNDLFRQGRIVIVYDKKHMLFPDYMISASREMYLALLNKHYASEGCTFEPVTIHADKYISADKFQLVCGDSGG